MSSGLASLDMGLEVVEGFSRPNWRLINDFVEQNVPSHERTAAWDFIAEAWLAQLTRDLGGTCRVSRSENFFCLSDVEPKTVESILSYAESVLRIVRAVLRDAAWTGYEGRHVLLVFSDPEDYFGYISYFYPEGSHTLTSGVFLGDGYAHIALPYANAWSTEHVLVHELVHNLLCHLAIPSWLNEGLAMIIERRLLRQPFPIDQELVGLHAGHWNEQNIQSFWAGISFDQPGQAQLSYSLAEILVSLLREKGTDFSNFILNADWNDAGQDSALKCLDVDLGDLAAGFLGKGNWRPRRKAIAELLGRQQ